MAKPISPAPEYQPAVFAPPDHDGKPYEIVDSVKGNPWHLARFDKDLFPGIQAAEGAFPVTREAFEEKAAKAPGTAEETQITP